MQCEEARRKEEVDKKHHEHMLQQIAELNRKHTAELGIERVLILMLHKLEQDQESELQHRGTVLLTV